MYTTMLKNQVNGCHGNHPFLKVQTSLSLMTKNICISGVPMNDLAPMKNCLSGCKVGQLYKYLPCISIGLPWFCMVIQFHSTIWTENNTLRYVLGCPNTKPCVQKTGLFHNKTVWCCQQRSVGIWNRNLLKLHETLRKLVHAINREIFQ